TQPGFFKEAVEAAQKAIGEGKPVGEAVGFLKAFSRETVEHRQAQLRSIEKFQETFQDILSQALSADQVLVLFIDDLDRCLPEKAIEVLEAIKLFLDVPRCAFFVAIDRQVIIEGVRVRYRDFDQHSPISGSEYIEKIIQLPFQLPPLKDEQVEEFICALDPRLPKPKENDPEQYDCDKVFALGLEPNPRKVKRTLRVFHLVWDLALQLSKKGKIEELNPALLAKVVIVQNRYPELHNTIAGNSSLLQELERTFREPPAEGRFTGKELGIKYQSLRSMFQQPSFFVDLSSKQLDEYVYLTRTASEGRVAAAEVSVSEQWWDDLISHDPTRIRAAVGGIKAADQVPIYVQRLLTVLKPATGYNVEQRISADLALSLLGDPRDFSETITVLPAEFIRGEGRQQKTARINYSFQMGKYLATNGQYGMFVKATPHSAPKHWPEGVCPDGIRNYPVVHISWRDAKAYCDWLTEKMRREDRIAAGEMIRLPREDEWELAARGLNGRVFPWGDDFDPTRCNTIESELGGTTPVGVYPDGASPCGAMDMAGNVLEWNEDGVPELACWVRGGSWKDSKEKARCAYHDRLNPAYHSDNLGFRIVIAPEQEKA
ncbi:MAG: SUMF1/EgtB/PvdO family nonheme iron enzyme, partial [Anaerolineae bacterium]|nr:SUMF1/EgtB/PvdO family nonheme iron enzyme [Anaerolineae bacterium]